MKDIKDKKELIDAARIAEQIPDEAVFWDEVEQRLEIEDQDLVKPREIKH